jgi:hypothetical protein
MSIGFPIVLGSVRARLAWLLIAIAGLSFTAIGVRPKLKTDLPGKVVPTTKDLSDT